MTKVVVDNEPVSVVLSDDTYSVSLSDDRIRVEVSDMVISTESVVAEEEVYDIEVDSSVAGVTYIGQASPGTAKSLPAWRIKKVTESESGFSVDWAAGTADFIHVWNNRLSYTYGP